MNRSTFLFLSTLFHPVFLNLLSFYLLIVLFPYLDYGLPLQAKIFYVLFIFISTGIVPLLFVGAMRLFGFAKSIMLQEKDERRLPYMITAGLCLFDFYLFGTMHTPALIRAFMLASASIVVCLLVINHFNKISIHASSFGMMAAIIICARHGAPLDIRLLLLPFSVCCGLTLSARLFAGAHNLQQLASGFLTGFGIMFFIL